MKAENMKSLNEDLKTREFKQVYLLYGEEVYLKKQYKEKLVHGMTAENDTMNYAYYEGKNTNPKEIIDLAETMPFFADRRLIVMENTGFLKNATPELADYLKTMPETTYMLFVEEELDKRGRLFKAIKDCGRAVELPRQDERTLMKWILSNVKKEGKQMEESVLRSFLSKVGLDMGNLQTEMEKLFCYTLSKKTITTEDVEEVCTTHIENRIFDMVNAVGERKSKKALDYYYDLLALKEPPMRILYLMSRQFKLLLEAKELEQKGYSRQEIAGKIGVPPFAVGKYQIQAKSFQSKELYKVLEKSAEIEEAVKTGRLSDTLGIELFICEQTSR